MRFLSIFGTLAMFLVGGGIVLHNVALFYAIERDILVWFKSTPEVGALFNAVIPSLLNLIAGMMIGLMAFIVYVAGKKLFVFFKTQ